MGRPIRVTALSFLLLLVASGGGRVRSSSNLTLSFDGRLPMLAATPFTTREHFFTILPTSMDAYLIAEPTQLVWSFTLRVDFCCPNSTDNATVSSGGFGRESGDSSWSTGSNLCGTPFAFAMTDTQVLLNCGPSTVILEAATGAVISVYELPNGNVAPQLCRVGPDVVAMRTEPYPSIAVFNTTTWELLWQQSYANATVPPLLDGFTGTIAAVQLNILALNATVTGFDGVTGRALWTEAMQWWATDNNEPLPIFAPRVFAWYGPDFASVRILYLPTGVVWQYVPGFTLFDMLPINNGLVIVASRYQVAVLDAMRQVVVWSVPVPIRIGDVWISDDGEYLMVWPADPTLSNVVLAMHDGTILTWASCGPNQCARPCVTRVAGYNATLVARCAPNRTDAAVLTLHDSVTGDVVSNSIELLVLPPFPLEINGVALGLLCAFNASETHVAMLSVRAPSSAPAASDPPVEVQRIGLVLTIVCAAALVGLSTSLVYLLVLRGGRRWSKSPPPVDSSVDSLHSDASLRVALNT